MLCFCAFNQHSQRLDVVGSLFSPATGLGDLYAALQGLPHALQRNLQIVDKQVVVVDSLCLDVGYQLRITEVAE